VSLNGLRTYKQRPGLKAQAVAVNCGYWTKAVALPRRPWHLNEQSLQAQLL